MTATGCLVDTAWQLHRNGWSQGGATRRLSYTALLIQPGNYMVVFRAGMLQLDSYLTMSERHGLTTTWVWFELGCCNQITILHYTAWQLQGYTSD